MSKFGWSYPAGAASDPNAPYNQVDFVIEDAIATRDLVCPSCQEPAVWFRDIEVPSAFNELTEAEVTAEGWHCENCDWEQESFEGDWLRLKKHEEEYEPRIALVQAAINALERKPAADLRDVFGDFVPDGDFDWNQEEAGDWNVYCCGEKDCEQQWHKSAPYTNMGRKDGKRWVELGTCDESCYWDMSCRWEEGDDFNDVGSDIANEMNDHFKGWAKYWLDCAETGKDPCGEVIGDRPSDWIEFCVKSAESFAGYLR
jgi:hypothetical protein